MGCMPVSGAEHSTRRKCFRRCATAMLLLCGVVSAQYGTAPNNYYPDSYDGVTFTGTVVSATQDTITLSYTHGNRTDTFEGYVTAPCNLPETRTTTRPTPLSGVPTGAVITAFYETKTIKVAGRKEKKNHIIAVMFQQVTSKPIADTHKAIFYCIPTPFHTTFKAW